MNDHYLYKYNSTGEQFLSFASPDIIAVLCKTETPICLGKWKFIRINHIAQRRNQLKNKNEKKTD